MILYFTSLTINCHCLEYLGYITLLLVSKFMRSYSSLLPTPQRNSFIPALLMTFVKKSMNLIRFPQISSSTFILFTNSNHGMAIMYFHFFERFFSSKLFLVKFGLSEKHTQFEKIFLMVLTNQLIL